MKQVLVLFAIALAAILYFLPKILDETDGCVKNVNGQCAETQFSP